MVYFLILKVDDIKDGLKLYKYMYLKTSSVNICTNVCISNVKFKNLK